MDIDNTHRKKTIIVMNPRKSGGQSAMQKYNGSINTYEK